MAEASDGLVLVEISRGSLQPTDHDHLLVHGEGLLLCDGHAGGRSRVQLVELAWLRRDSGNEI